MGLRGNAPAAAPQRCVLRGRRVAAASNGSVVRCAKEGIHPKFFPEAKACCRGARL